MSPMKIVVACITSLVGVGTSYAQSCSNASLSGVYPFTASGFSMGIYDAAGTVHYFSPPQPFSSIGQYTFDGQGTFTRVDFPVANGVPISSGGFRTGVSGSYSIAEDCTGQIALSGGSLITLQVVVVDFGLSARAIVASEHVPSFVNPPEGTSCASGCDESVNILIDLKKDVRGRRDELR